MLILTRKIGEALAVGENIRVVILGINGQQVKVGIDAPPEIIVNREELLGEDRTRRAARAEDSFRCARTTSRPRSRRY